MPLSYVYDLEARMLFISVGGQMTAGEVEEMFREICENGDIPNDVDAIWNLNEYGFEAAERKNFQALISRRAKRPDRSCARIVLVAETDLGFGMCRMYQIMCDLNQTLADNTTYVARTEKEAVDWLNASQEPLTLMRQQNRQF